MTAEKSTYNPLASRSAKRRKSLLFAVAVLRDDLPLIENAIRSIATDPTTWHFLQHLHLLWNAIDVIERAAHEETAPREEEEFRDAWLRGKEAAILDQDFEIAAYLRNVQDILMRVEPASPQLPPPYVRAARELLSGGLAWRFSCRPNASNQHQAHEEKAVQSRRAVYNHYLTEVFGPSPSPGFSPAWRTDTAIALARQMYDSRDFGAMPILADALQDAGCDNEDILNHCRDTNQVHVRGCWVVDLVLGKE
jgi:hypothetical protein